MTKRKYIVYRNELELLSLSIANGYTMKMKNLIPSKESLFEESYNILVKNITKSVNKFIVFRDKGNVVEIEHGIGQRSIYVDLLISHFENKEEYEKCEKLLKLKELVIMAGD